MAENKTSAKIATSDSSKDGSSLKKLFGRKDIGVVIATSLLFIVFTLLTESFFTRYNLYNVSRTAALYIFVALGQMIVLVVGDMNISLGAIGALTVVVAGWTMDTMGLSPILGVIIPLFVGTSAGFLNGLVIVKTKINSFIITLASLFILTGLFTGISKGFPYTEIPDSFTFLGRKALFGVPALFWFALLFLAILSYIFKYTVVGRHLLATGGNRDAAQLSGIRTNNIEILAHSLSGFFAGIAGLLWVSRMGSAQPATGRDWLIISFAVSIIGGTGLAGGETSMLGMLFSAILLTLIKNGLIMLNVNIYYEQTFLGLLILLAVSLDLIRSQINRVLKLIRKGGKKSSKKE